MMRIFAEYDDATGDLAALVVETNTGAVPMRHLHTVTVQRPEGPTLVLAPLAPELADALALLGDFGFARADEVKRKNLERVLVGDLGVKPAALAAVLAAVEDAKR